MLGEPCSRDYGMHLLPMQVVISPGDMHRLRENSGRPQKTSPADYLDPQQSHEM